MRPGFHLQSCRDSLPFHRRRCPRAIRPRNPTLRPALLRWTTANIAGGYVLAPRAARGNGGVARARAGPHTWAVRAVMNACVALGNPGKDNGRMPSYVWIDFTKGLSSPPGGGLAAAPPSSTGLALDSGWVGPCARAARRRRMSPCSRHHWSRLADDPQRQGAGRGALRQMPGMRVEEPETEPRLLFFVDPEPSRSAGRSSSRDLPLQACT